MNLAQKRNQEQVVKTTFPLSIQILVVAFINSLRNFQFGLLWRFNNKRK